MSVAWFVSLYAYDRWANNRILKSVACIEAEGFLADRGPGARSIRDTLTHTMLAHRFWLERWRGVAAPSGMGDPAAYPDLASIRDAWAAVEDDTAAFLSLLPYLSHTRRHRPTYRSRGDASRVVPMPHSPPDPLLSV